MQAEKVKQFMQLAGVRVGQSLSADDPALRALGAQLLLSEVLEYVVKGLGVIPEVNGVRITEPDALHYHPERTPHPLEMIDGLSDVAYTMFWNAFAFGIPLEDAFELVAANNLEKFVRLEGWQRGECELERDEWHCGCDIRWPEEVTSVRVLKVDGAFFAVGKDARGKVRKPSSYRSVDLSGLLPK